MKDSDEGQLCLNQDIQDGKDEQDKGNNEKQRHQGQGIIALAIPSGSTG